MTAPGGSQVAFPFHLRFGRTARRGGAAHVRDLIEQFLFTEPGERVNRPDFGAGLSGLVFEPAGVELAAAVELRVSAGLLHWLGDLIDVRRVDVRARGERIEVELDYEVRATGERRVDTFARSGP